MALRDYPSFSLLFVATAAVVLLFAAGGAEARFKGINQWCRTSDYKALCTQMVKGATTQKGAMEKYFLFYLNLVGSIVCFEYKI